MRVLFVIPTTGGPIVIRRIVRRDLPLSLVVADGDYRPLPASEDYGRLLAADGPLASLLGARTAGSFELRIDRPFETGRSWEMPVALAHAALAWGWTLVDDPAKAERVVFTTGALDRDLRLVAADYSLPVKADRSAELLSACADRGATAFALVPAGDPQEKLALVKIREIFGGAGEPVAQTVASLSDALTILGLEPRPAQKPPTDLETAAVKRKIAAILAADVASYSRLVAEDEEGTLRRLAAYREVFDDFVKRAGGRIFNTAGDSVMCEFESAVEAVRCAIDIQEALRPRNADLPPERKLQFRIGISIGDVVERGGDLLGDGVNVAARLESIAEPGGICVSRSVQEAVSNKVSVRFHDMGAREVKNIPQPVHAFSVTPPGVAAMAAAPAKPAAAAPQPGPAAPAVGGRSLMPAAAIAAAAVLGLGAGAYLYLGGSSKEPVQAAAVATPAAPEKPASPARPAAPERTAAATTAQPPARPAAPAAPAALPAAPVVAPAPVTVEELRSAPGRTCADLVFGGATPTRTPVALRDAETLAASSPAGLCGLAIRTAPGADRVGFRLDPSLTSAAIVSNAQPGPASGEFAAATLMFRQSAKLPTRHAIEVVDHRDAPPRVRRLVHDLSPGDTGALAPRRVAQH